eukprot:gene22943-biopygen11785
MAVRAKLPPSEAPAEPHGTASFPTFQYGASAPLPHGELSKNATPGPPGRNGAARVRSASAAVFPLCTHPPTWTQLFPSTPGAPPTTPNPCCPPTHLPTVAHPPPNRKQFLGKCCPGSAHLHLSPCFCTIWIRSSSAASRRRAEAAHAGGRGAGAAPSPPLLELRVVDSAAADEAHARRGVQRRRAHRGVIPTQILSPGSTRCGVAPLHFRRDRFKKCGPSSCSCATPARRSSECILLSYAATADLRWTLAKTQTPGAPKG